MSADPRRRRRATLVALGSAMAVVAAVPVMSVAAWRAIRDSKAAQNVGVITSLTLPSTPTGLIAGVDEMGEVTSIAVIALRPQGAGGTVVSLPVGARSLGGGDSVRRLADSYAVDGVDAFVADVEGLMSATMTDHAVMREEELADLLAPFGKVEVTLASDLRDSAADTMATPDESGSGDSTPVDSTPGDSVPGDSVPGDEPGTGDAGDTAVDPDAAVVVPSGTSTLDAGLLAAALTSRVEGEAESVRFDDIGSIWDGVAASVGAGRGKSAAAGTGEPTAIADIVRVLAAGRIDVWQVGFTPIVDADRNPDELDLYDVRSGELVLVMASVAPSSMIAALPGPAMQLDSSFKDANVSLAAVDLLYFFSINTMLVREVEGDPPPVSIVRYAEVGDSEDFSFLEEIIGPIEVERIDSRVEGIDFEVVLGESFVPHLATLEFAPGGQVGPTTSDAPADAPGGPDADGDNSLDEEGG